MADPEDTTSDLNEPSGSTQERFLAHKAHARSHGRPPMSWGTWLAAGMPLAYPADTPTPTDEQAPSSP